MQMMTTEKEQTDTKATRKSYAELEREVIRLRAQNARMFRASQERLKQITEINNRLKRIMPLDTD